MWKFIVIMAYLTLLSVFDKKEKAVPVRLLFLGGIGCIVMASYEVFVEKMGFMWLILGLLPGIFFLLVAWLTKKAGYADGIVLLFLGAVYGYRESVLVLGVSLFLAALLSVVLLIMHKVQRNTKLPYIPFLAVAFLIEQIIVSG